MIESFQQRVDVAAYLAAKSRGFPTDPVQQREIWTQCARDRLKQEWRYPVVHILQVDPWSVEESSVQRFFFSILRRLLDFHVVPTAVVWGDQAFQSLCNKERISDGPYRFALPCPLWVAGQAPHRTRGYSAELQRKAVDCGFRVVNTAEHQDQYLADPKLFDAMVDDRVFGIFYTACT